MFDVERFINLMGIAIERNERGRKRFEKQYTDRASPAQLAKIEKANKLGWYVSSFYVDGDKEVVLRNNSNKAEMVIDFNGKVYR